jgi:AhpD family alkylhydroperoxidase
VANYTRVFALRPEVLAGWAQLNGAIKHGLDLRRYELATLAAARALRSTYCAMAHGRVLRAALTVGRAPQPSGRPTALPAAREAS